MAIFPEYRIRCDNCGRIDHFTGRSERHIWKQARGNQWRRQRGGDICPECSGINADYWHVGF